MSVTQMPRLQLRWGRSESSRLTWAFVISIVLHLLVFGTWKTGDKFGWWKNLHLPTWMESTPMLTQILKKKEPPPHEELNSQPPLMFVDVSPAQATAVAPKDAKFYSDKNSVAANPEVVKPIDVPNITGTQTEVVKTETVKPKFTPLQPAAPPANVNKEEQTEQKAKPAETPGDLAMGKVEPKTEQPKEEGIERRSRPKTIREALARRQESNIPGEKMKQEGGVRRRLEISSVDAKATPFGAYDAALVEAISQRWYSLLDDRVYASDSRGKVVLQFVLHPDGRITEMNMTETTVGEVLGLICQKAVLDPAPYPAWPSEMRRLLGESRNIQFTFYYN